MCIAYITQSLDKGTLGTSSIMGWITDVGAKGQDYALTSTFLWIGIIIGEPIVRQPCESDRKLSFLGQSMYSQVPRGEGARWIHGRLVSGEL
jgi:hypothetical protein